MKPRAAVAVWLLALAACIAVIAQTRFGADMSAFLPQRPSASQQLLVDQLRAGTLSRLLLVGIEGGDAAARAGVSRRLAERLRAAGEFASVQNGDAAALARDREILFANRYLLSPAVDERRFTAAGLAAAIAESIDLLASPAGLMIKGLLVRDPTGEMVELATALAPGRQPASDHGVWASGDGRRALLMALTTAAGADTDGQERALARVRAEFAADPQAAGLRLLMSGAPVFAVDARATIKGEVERLAWISAGGIVVVLLLVYRSLAALALGLLPVLSGALAGIAAVGLGFGQVHGLTVGFGTTLIGEAVDYSIYYFVQSQPGAEGEWRQRFWPTIRLGVLTSLCGFAALLFSGFPGLAQLGLYSISGLAVAAAVTRFVLPALRPAGFRLRDTRALGAACAVAVGVLGRWRWLAWALTALAVAGLLAQRDRLWTPRLVDLSPMSPALLALDQSLRGDLGAPGQGQFVVVAGDDLQAALLAAEDMAGRLAGLVERGVIAGFETPSRFLPSTASQLARRQALPPRDRLEADLRLALAGLPLRAGKLVPFLDDVEHARRQPLLTLDALQGSGLGLAVESMLMAKQAPATGRLALLPLYAPAAAAIDGEAVRAAIAGAAGAAYLDLAAESDRLYADYLDEAMRLSLAGVLAIAVLLAAALRSPARLLGVMAPLAMSVLLVMAGLALAGERLTLLHLVGLLLIVALGSNYALFFARGGGRVAAVDQPGTLPSLLIANLTTVIGFGALATSTVPVLHAIGVTVAPGAVLALVLSATLARRQEPA